MTRPSVYVTVIRTLFGILFVGGSVVHLYGGVTSPLSYGPFGDTAWPPLDELWTGFVMPNIAWLALCMAAFELAVGVTAWLPARWNRISVIGMTCFFAFLIVLGYAFPTATALEDFLVNRAGSLVMIALVVPWLMRPQLLSVPGAWSALVRRGPTPGTALRHVHYRAALLVRAALIRLNAVADTAQRSQHYAWSE